MILAMPVPQVARACHDIDMTSWQGKSNALVMKMNVKYSNFLQVQMILATPVPQVTRA